METSRRSDQTIFREGATAIIISEEFPLVVRGGNRIELVSIEDLIQFTNELTALVARAIDFANTHAELAEKRPE